MEVWRRAPDCEPEAVGLKSAVLDRMAERFAAAVSQDLLFSGAQLTVYRNGRRMLDIGGGVARPRVGVAVTPETMFVIFSSTKGLAALAMWMLHERGALDIDARVVEYWPTFSSVVPEKNKVTIRHLLSHRAGFPTGPEWFTARWWNDREAMVRAMEEVPLQWSPGEANGYHALNSGWVSNELCMRTDVQGRDLGRFLREEALGPLGVADAYLGVPDDPAYEDRVAWAEEPVEAPGAAVGRSDRTFRSPVTDDRHRETPELSIPWNRAAVHRAVVPGAGAVATARDLARVYAMLALWGELDDVRVIARETLEEALVPTNAPGEIDRTTGTPIRWGTGWQIGTPAEQLGAATGSRDGDDPRDDDTAGRTFGHGGRGGQMGWADLDRGLAFGFATTGQLRTEAFQAWLRDMLGLTYRACAN